MTGEAPSDPSAGSSAEAVEPLYRDFLSAFYEKNERTRAESLAPRLELLLTEQADIACSIRGDEIRALLAELRGDQAEAILLRERELRRILQLHSVTVNKPEWDGTLLQYDHRDVADRIDLLGILYFENGDRDRAIATLEDSRRFCTAHGIAFDGEDLLANIQQEAQGLTPDSASDS